MGGPGKGGKGGYAEERPTLRFQVGSRVQCLTGNGWAMGTVMDIWYRESHMKKGFYAPYQVKLDDGPLIFAPMDDDRVVRAATGFLAESKVPVTILTGFLGSGKTTLLNYILNAQHGKKYAVIENEIGAVGVDNLLLQGYKDKTEEDIVLLDNGCLCCTVRGDLIKAIKGIIQTAKDREKAAEASGDKTKVLNGILIETTGMADPGPICKTFYGDEFCRSVCKIDGVVTVVDAVHFIEQLTRERSEGAVNESAQQVAYADKVLLNKVDATNDKKLKDTMDAIRGVNHLVPVTQCSLLKDPAALPLDKLLGIDSYDLDKLGETNGVDFAVCGEVDKYKDKEKEKAAEHGAGHGAGHGSGHGGAHEKMDVDGHGHDHDGDGHGHDHDGDGHGHDHDGDGHGHDHDGEGHGHGHDDHDDEDGHGHSHDEDGGHGHSHGHDGFRHDSGVGSFVCTVEGKPITEDKFNTFMMGLLREHAPDLYRHKGILAMDTSDGVMRCVLQGVHEMVDFTPQDQWPKDTPYKSQIVLIGRKLDKEKWTAEFQKCVQD